MQTRQQRRPRTQLLLSYGSQAKPAPMAPPAPGSRAGPASCDVTGVRHRPAEGGQAGRGPLQEVRRPGLGPRRPLRRKWAGLGGQRGRLATLGRPPPPPLPGPPFTGSAGVASEVFRTCAACLCRVQHIVGNLSMQLVLGIPLEMVHKGLRVGLVYLAGVLAGSLASSIFDPFNSLVGASGGVYALMGGYFMNVIVNFREMIPACGIFRLLVIILIVASDMGFALYRRFFVPANGSPVSFAAHIAGGFAGMSIGYTVFSCFDKTLLKDPRFWIAIAAYVACLLFAVFFNIFLSPAN
nr:rhomboid-related protein 2 [Peromyscus maniculatus bairdii]